MSRHRKTLLVLLVLGGAMSPVVAGAQEREVLSKQISVGRSEATLGLEFSDRTTIRISLDEGDVLVDGAVVATYTPGGELDSAWRRLLASAIALEENDLAEALAEWEGTGDGPDGAAAGLIDSALEEAVTGAEGPAPVPVSAAPSEEVAALLRALATATGDRFGIRELLDDPNLVVYIQDVEVPEGEVFEGTILSVDSDVRVAGTVDGHVVALGGRVDIEDGGRVTGGVHVARARVTGDRDAIAGGVVNLESGSVTEAREAVAEAREARNEARREFLSVRVDRDADAGLFRPFRAVAEAVGGVLENVLAVLVLAIIGTLVIFFGGRHMDVIAETARRAPGRAAAVGIAGSILLLPVWLLGFVALLISIVGIPVAIAWLPLFPIAAVLAAVVGYLAVARNAGEWLADSDYPWTHWIRKSNPLLTMVGGLMGLMLLFVAGNVVSAAPFLGFIEGLLVAAGVVVTFLAVQVGFGAVILTRAGRRPEQGFGYDADAAWKAAMEVEIDDEVTTTGGQG